MLPRRSHFFISDIMNKNLSFEMQKVSLALLLINNGSASLLLTEKRVREETAPFSSVWFSDDGNRLHARYLCTTWQYLKENLCGQSHQTAVDAYLLYMADCLPELGSAPLLNLVQAMALIQAYENCALLAGSCPPVYCFGQQQETSALEEWVYACCMGVAFDVLPAQLTNVCDCRISCSPLQIHP